MRTVLFIFSLACMMLPASAWSGGLDDLKHFYSETQTFSADFSQDVFDDNSKLLESSSGSFMIARPGRFRWHYVSPSEQLIIGDGQQVWIYDVELEQATQRKSVNAVAGTPAMLLSGTGDLEEDFELQELDSVKGVDWVKMVPRQTDAGFIEIAVGFSGGRIAMIILRDSFGHTTRITLRNMSETIEIKEDTFTFSPPEGVDVIREGE